MKRIKLLQHFKLRSIKKACLMLVSLSLIFLMGCAVQRENSAGKVNGVYIKKQDFMNAIRGHFSGFVLENDRTPDDAEKKDLNKQTWKDITVHVILTDYFQKYKIQVTQQEVVDTLLNNIPESMKKAPTFQTDGQFDRMLYVQALISDKSQTLDWLKQYYFEYYVPTAKLKLELQNKEIISKAELIKLDKVINSKADIDWIVFDPAKTKVEVSQSEIENYYSAHMNDYKIKPYASFGWVSAPVQVSNEDNMKAKTKVDSIYFQLVSGGSFTDFVERFSQSASAASGGSLGFINTDDLPEAVSAAIQGIAKDGVTRPVKHKNSWVIYQVVERTKNLVKLNELVIKINPGSESKEAGKTKAIDLRDLALQLNLGTAAQEMDLEYKLSGVVAKDSLWLSDGDLSAYLTDRAFTQKVGSILEPVYSEQLQAWIVAVVLDVQPYQYKPILDVNDEISALIQSSRQKAKTMETAVNWAQLNKNKQLEAAQNQNLLSINTPDILVTSIINSVPIRSNFVKIINDFQQNKAQRPYQIGDKILLPVVSKVGSVNPPLFTMNDVRNYYFQYLNPDWFNEWLDGEIKKAVVNVWFVYP
jgi:parvulin-like peptidyl-prolyl isomerase